MVASGYQVKGALQNGNLEYQRYRKRYRKGLIY